MEEKKIFEEREMNREAETLTETTRDSNRESPG